MRARASYRPSLGRSSGRRSRACVHGEREGGEPIELRAPALRAPNPDAAEWIAKYENPSRRIRDEPARPDRMGENERIHGIPFVDRLNFRAEVSIDEVPRISDPPEVGHDIAGIVASSVGQYMDSRPEPVQKIAAPFRLYEDVALELAAFQVIRLRDGKGIRLERRGPQHDVKCAL